MLQRIKFSNVLYFVLLVGIVMYQGYQLMCHNYQVMIMLSATFSNVGLLWIPPIASLDVLMPPLLFKNYSYMSFINRISVFEFLTAAYFICLRRRKIIAEIINSFSSFLQVKYRTVTVIR